jgi:hypothetical protein
MAKDVQWSEEKDSWLKRERGLSFSMVEEAITNHRILADIPHTNKNRPNQRILIFDLRNHVVSVPYVQDGDIKFLKTMHFSRSLKARYGVKNG